MHFRAQKCGRGSRKRDWMFIEVRGGVVARATTPAIQPTQCPRTFGHRSMFNMEIIR